MVRRGEGKRQKGGGQRIKDEEGRMNDEVKVVLPLLHRSSFLLHPSGAANVLCLHADAFIM
jgi:hypothetical protein